jgi:hypothetical protein
LCLSSDDLSVDVSGVLSMLLPTSNLSVNGLHLSSGTLLLLFSGGLSTSDHEFSPNELHEGKLTSASSSFLF